MPLFHEVNLAVLSSASQEAATFSSGTTEFADHSHSTLKEYSLKHFNISPEPIYAIVLSTLGSFLTALSLALMKLAYIKLESQAYNEGSSKQRPIFCHPLWLVGFIIATLSIVVNTCKFASSSDRASRFAAVW